LDLASLGYIKLISKCSMIMTVTETFTLVHNKINRK
jgi:hypothetical protein